MKKTNIALIGFMGTGKTVVGKLVAKKLKKEFIEMDDYIEKLAGKSIPKIFKEDGELIFRELEIKACKELSKKSNSVLSCGGGIILNKINLDYLRPSSVIICLDASPKVIYKRTVMVNKNKRPLLANSNPLKSIINLLKYRAPLYKRATEYHINTNKLTPDQVADKVIKIYQKVLENDTK
ncbi:MAG: shikimate kinase [Candidatus Helarchaeota archaeon]